MSEESTESKAKHESDFCLPIKRILPEFESVTERYFEPRFRVSSIEDASKDECILFHSNRICVLTLAPSHPIVAEKKNILNIDFRVNGRKGNNTDRSRNKVSGKWKKGGQQLAENSTLCTIRCEDRTSYPVVACLKATLVEINENLSKNPQLICEHTWSDGFIAILLPSRNSVQSQKETLLTPQMYKEILEKRKNECNS
ncbi:hypothetical protein B4U79_11685 [Dinothrombium tinctorium]|uniref:Protein Abitram n=1 Tax=Dinothrombium tinctorium TaxID=1965070 RepID=A0A3S3P490_9ACAR|nr:hypothetical protein B4U79_11685 [Dinothrombium tinctorium]